MFSLATPSFSKVLITSSSACVNNSFSSVSTNCLSKIANTERSEKRSTCALSMPKAESNPASLVKESY